MRPFLGTTIFLLVASSAHGGVRVGLPLQGYYRPGMYMPVRIEGLTSAAPVEINGTGVITTRVAADSVAPVLVTGFVDGLAVGGVAAAGPFRPVPDRVRLVGRAVARPRPAEATDIVINLDPLDPVPGPAAAWELLDELVFDAHASDRIGHAKLAALLAHGVSIVSYGDNRPAGILPWVSEGDRWAVRVTLYGPRGSIVQGAMLPAEGAGRATPIRFRQTTLLVAILFSILVTGLALLGGRRSVAATAVLVCITVAAIGIWQARQPDVTTVGGSIAIDGRALRQVDVWTYHFAARQDTLVTLPAGARPVAESSEALAGLDLTLHAPNVLECRVPRGERLASLHRTLTLPYASFPDRSITSPLLPLVKAGYLGPGVKAVGQIPNGSWPTVVLQAAKP